MGALQPGPYGKINVVMGIQVSLPRRGRPRNPACDKAIVAAGRAVLAERGFTGTSMDEIARRAGVGKDTLYRRWPSKEALVRHLMTVLAEEHVPVPTAEDPRQALLAFLEEIVEFITGSDFGAIIAGIVGESARNATVASDFRQFWKERRAIAARLLRRLIGSEVGDQEVGLILDHILGPIYYRILLSGDTVTRDYLETLVDRIPGYRDTIGGQDPPETRPPSATFEATS